MSSDEENVVDNSMALVPYLHSRELVKRLTCDEDLHVLICDVLVRDNFSANSAIVPVAQVARDHDPRTAPAVLAGLCDRTYSRDLTISLHSDVVAILGITDADLAYRYSNPVWILPIMSSVSSFG